MGKAKAPVNTPISGIDYLLDQETHQDLKKPWMNSKQFILGTTGNLATIMDECIASGRYALDLETSGLDNRVKARDSGRFQTVDTIAGVCLSPDGVKGYYIPLHHWVETGVGDFRDHEANVPLNLFDQEFRRLLAATEAGKTVAIFHNGKFDQEFLQFNETGIPWGEWDRHAIWEDTLILAYLRNTRARSKRLKALSGAPTDAGPEHQCGGPGLGMEMIDLHQLWGHPKGKKGYLYNFSILDPTDEACLWYACSDAICTWLLYGVLKGAALDNDSDDRNQAKIYQIEKVCVAATRWMERNRIHIDRKKVLELILLGQQEWMGAIMEVYNEASKLLSRDVMPVKYVYLREHFKPDEGSNLLYQQLERATINTAKFPNPTPLEINDKVWPAIYDVNSQQQLGQMFDEMEVPGLKYTEKSGQVVTRKVEIDRIVEETGTQFPFMGKVRRFREVSKALSTYLFPMLEDSDPEDDTMRINFQGHKTDTGRFSTPAKESISGDQGRNRVIGWPQVNVQATPKHTTDTSPKGRPACMGRLRECYTVRPPGKGKPAKFLVAIDFAGVELRLVTNLSREIKWLSEFFHCSECDRTFERVGRPDTGEIATQTPLPPPARCPNCGGDRIGDLHALTGISIYGQEAPTKSNWKELRGHSKCVHPDTIVRLEAGPGRIGLLPIGPLDTFLPVDSQLLLGSEVGNRVLETYNGGVKPLYHVISREGILTCSAEHRLQLADGSLRSINDGLKVGDDLAELMPSMPCKIADGVPVLSYQTTPEVVYLAGLFPGDGMRTNGHQILRIPDWIWQTGSEALMFFLGGLFDTDGTVSARDGNLSVTMKDAIFAGQIAAALSVLGFTPRTEACWNKTYQRWYYRVKVLGSQAPRFKPYMRHPGKLNRIQPCRALTPKPNQVRWIIPAGDLPCMDVRVSSGSHLYWANGIISHNSLNFALCYGGGGRAAQRAVGVDTNEGRRLKRQFDQTYLILSTWWKKQHQFAKKHGFVRTAFSRKYPVPDINSPDGGFRSKAERNSVNGPVQGSSVDITKTAMALIYKEMKQRGWLDKVMMTITMHDELVFEIDGDVLEEALGILVHLMTSNRFVLGMNWPIPLTADVEIGYDWTVPWDINKMKYGEIRFDGNTKVKRPKNPSDLVNGQPWNSLPAWPEDLRPCFKDLNAAGIPVFTPAPISPPAMVSDTAALEPVGEAAPAPMAIAVAMTPGVELVPVDAGGDFVFKLGVPLSLAIIPALCETICRCMQRGTSRLVIYTNKDELLEGWDELIPATLKPSGGVRVSATEFMFTARDRKLCR